ncbi:MAG TPA: MmcQ/YjbR family DNA-binding protein [Rhizomicrobium sp.]|jgi:predicted DNA-binding protein (MmcQ/YjbR family)
MSLAKKLASVKACIESQPGAVGSPLATASAPGVTLYKVKDKMFAILTVHRITAVSLKCDPHLVEILRAKYDGVGHRGHLDRRFWISVNLDADVPVKEINRLVAHSYGQVTAKLTRKQKAELAAL